MKARLSAHTLFAIAIVASCSTTGGSGGGTQDYVPGTYDTPPPDFDPTPGQDQPPSDYDDPSGPGSGAGSRACASVCQTILVAGCTEFGEDLQTCTAACVADLEIEPCTTELIALAMCAVRSPDFTCELLTGGMVDPGAFPECQSQATLYAICLENNPDGGEGGQGGV